MNHDVGDIRKRTRQGIAAGIGCYLLWGLFPLYWKLLDHVDPLEVTAQRVIWCFALTAIICLIARWNFTSLLKDKRALCYLIPAAIIITSNWGTYIFAVHIDHIVEASLGYYINPLVSILLGLVIFKERLSPLQWIAVALCCIGILYFTISYGSFPWLAIYLAVSFGVYGAIKKKGGYPAVEAIAVESAVMTPVAIVFAIVLAFATGSHGFLGDVTSAAGWSTTGLLILGGAVTAVPLILFATAANSIPLTILGFMQYVSPTIALLCGVFVNGEAFTVAHGICFACIWCGLALVAIDMIRAARKTPEGEITPLEAEEAAEIVE